MIETIEIDLTDDQWRPPFTLSGTAWALIRAGRHVLGEERLVGVSPLELVDHKSRLVRAYAARLGNDQREALDGSGVTIVVCTRDRPRLLEGCLAAISLLQPMCAEVIVVDNASTERSSRQIAESFGVTVVSEPTPGLDRARNMGFHAASTNVVAFVDDDARVDKHFAGALGQIFDHAGIQAVTGLVLPAELETYPQQAFEMIEGGMRKGFRCQVFDRARVGLQAFRVGVGTNMAFRRELLDRLGGFDLRFDVGTRTKGAGDLDLFWRCLQAGVPVVYDPDVLVRHIHRRDRRGLLNQMRDNGTAYAAFLESRSNEWPDFAGSVRRERLRWHWSRHVVRPVSAIARREFLELQMAIFELLGSLQGGAALRSETLDRKAA
ncbi:hypothetical protein BH18ACT6_BH18ACT6_17760 [soil metagenome]